MDLPGKQSPAHFQQTIQKPHGDVARGQAAYSANFIPPLTGLCTLAHEPL